MAKARILRGRPAALVESSEHVVEIRGDPHFIIEEVIEPEELLPFGQGDQGKQVAQADANGGMLVILVRRLRRARKNTKARRGHENNLPAELAVRGTCRPAHG